MTRDQTFEAAYPRHEFAPLVRWAVAFAAWIAGRAPQAAGPLVGEAA